MHKIPHLVSALAMLATGTVIGVTSQQFVSADATEGNRPVLVPIEPCRLADTRSNQQVGQRGTPLGPQETEIFGTQRDDTKCVGAIPADAVGLSMNITALQATELGFLTIWSGGEMPLAASLNPAPGQPPVPNAVTTELADDGTFQMFNFAGTTEIVIDAIGYYVNHSHDDRYYTEPEVDALLLGIESGNGPIGPTGPQGPAGADGAQGPEGPASAPGGQGPPGADGVEGPAGTTGPAGAAGPAGTNGDNGAQGPAGTNGDDGAQGPAGTAGSAGAAGPAGTNGDNGAQGPAGTNGDNGAQGPAGTNGDNGDDGAAGTNGDDGATGPQGPAGPQGAPGTDLFDRTVVVNGGDTDVNNGAALVAAINTVAAATPTAADPWMIKLEPGVYNAALPDLPPNVRIEGSGRDSTTVTCSTCRLFDTTGPVTIADLTATSARIMFLVGDDTRLERVVFRTTVSGSSAISVAGGVTLTITDSVIEKSGTGGQAIDLNTGSGYIVDSEILASGAAARGIETNGILRLTGSRIIAASASALFMSFSAPSDVEIVDSHLENSGAVSSGAITRHVGTAATVTISGSTVSGPTHAIEMGSPAVQTLNVDNSVIDGNIDRGNSLYTLTATIRNSTVLGTVTAATEVCLGVADATTWYDNTCP